MDELGLGHHATLSTTPEPPALKQLKDIIQELRACCAAARTSAEPRLDVVETETLQMLELALRLDEHAAPEMLALRDLGRLLHALDPSLHPWATRHAQQLATIYLPASDEVGLVHDVEVARRVLSAHVFLEGSRVELDFGAAHGTADGDLLVGLGLRTSTGSLQHFLTALARQSGYASPVLALRPYFDAEAERIAHAIEEGHGALTEFLRSLLVFRMVPGNRGLSATLPDRWQSRFRRLASRLEARRLQLEFYAGEQLVMARQTADAVGLHSLRGLALAFDTQPLLRRLEFPTLAKLDRSAPEGERMLGFAERILHRVQGPFAEAWTERVRGLVQGAGTIAGRSYQEQRFLGPSADRQPWRFCADACLSEGNDDTPLSRIPIQGRDYVVQAGDRLSSIAHQAYQGKADFRFLLEHNPQLRSTAALLPGQRLNIPLWPPRPEAVALNTVRNRGQIRVEAPLLYVDERPIGPWPARSQAELEAFAHRLGELDLSAFARARCLHSPDGWLLSIDGQVLGQIDERELPQARQLFPELEDPLESWAALIAAQLRADLLLSPRHFLPFGHRPLEPFRAQWFKTTLQRALREHRLDEARLRLPSTARHVDIVASDGENLLRLETEDLDAIRQRPGRRLGELGLAALPSAIALARLWLGDALGRHTEVPVWPLNDARRYPIRETPESCFILAPVGSTVFPIMLGRVVYCGLTGSAGLAALVEHPGGLYSRYMHLGSLAVRANQRLSADRPLGRVAMSGDISEPGLAFGVEKRPEPSDEWRMPTAQSLDFRRVLGCPFPSSPAIDFELYSELGD